MKNKTILISGILVVVLILVLFFIFVWKGRSVINHTPYEKYMIKATVKTKVADKSETVNLVVKDDGENASVLSSSVSNTGYILGNALYYLKDNNYYIYTSEMTYRDLLRLISRLKLNDKIKEVAEYTYYSKVLDEKEVNDILKSLYIDKETSSSKVVRIVTERDDIIEFSMSLDDIEGYESIDIAISFEELDDDFKIDTSTILSARVGGVMRVEYEHTDENIFKIGK